MGSPFTVITLTTFFANKIKEKRTMPTLNTVAFDRFIHWITERHNIYLRRLAGQEKPWTEDKVLQRYFFTNPYRENDKVTVWFHENIRNPLADPDCEDPTILPWATVAFRWFNYIPTGESLLQHRLIPVSSLAGWDNGLAKQVLHNREQKNLQVFTGAYMIKIENGRSKIDSACDQIAKLWDRRANFHESLCHCKTLEHGHKIVSRIPFIGPFMAYEIITDLRHTPTDIMTWCNIGPGAIRGLYRLTHSDDEAPPMRSLSSSPKKNLPVMQQLMSQVNKELIRANLDTVKDLDFEHCPGEPKYPLFEMRDLEHSLCEFDKYCRALYQQGTMKRKYPGV
jgi:hypothetical protein